MEPTTSTSAPPPARGTRGMVLAAIALAALALLSYLPALHFPWVYDDVGQIVSNPYLRQSGHLAEVLQGKTVGDTDVLNGRRPLVLATYLLNWRMVGDRVAAWRMVNIAAHAATVIALLLLWYRLARRQSHPAPWLLATGAAGLFAVHPVLAEAVQVVSFRADILCTLCLVLYVHGVLAASGPGWRGRWGMLLAGGCLVLALGAKETALAAPALPLALWIFFPGTRPTRRRGIIILAGSLFLVGVFLFACLGGESFQAATGAWNGRSLRVPDNLHTFPWLVAVVLRLLVWPHPLIIDRVIDPVVAWSDPRIWVGLGVLILIAALWVTAWKRQRGWLGWSLTWIMVLYLPAANLLPLFNPLADRYLYGPVAGWTLLASAVLVNGSLRLAGASRWRRLILLVLAAGSLGLLQWRLRDFRSEELLWERTLADEPRSDRALTWLGIHQLDAGNLEAATRHFQQAVEVNPEAFSARTNLAVVHMKQGHLEAAETVLREALVVRPDKVSLNWNLAVVLQKQQRMQEAWDQADRTLALDPFHREALMARVSYSVQDRDFETARKAVETMLERDPADRQALEAKAFLDRIPENP